MQALERDSNRCVITGVYDLEYAKRNLKDIKKGVTSTVTACVHIFPESLGYEHEKEKKV